MFLVCCFLVLAPLFMVPFFHFAECLVCSMFHRSCQLRCLTVLVCDNYGATAENLISGYNKTATIGRAAPYDESNAHIQ